MKIKIQIFPNQELLDALPPGTIVSHKEDLGLTEIITDDQSLSKTIQQEFPYSFISAKQIDI